jgi:hypothetical protein
MRDLILFSGGAFIGGLIACVILEAVVVGGRNEHR